MAWNVEHATRKNQRFRDQCPHQLARPPGPVHAGGERSQFSPFLTRRGADCRDPSELLGPSMPKRQRSSSGGSDCISSVAWVRLSHSWPDTMVVAPQRKFRDAVLSYVGRISLADPAPRHEESSSAATSCWRALPAFHPSDRAPRASIAVHALRRVDRHQLALAIHTTSTPGRLSNCWIAYVRQIQETIRRGP